MKTLSYEEFSSILYTLRPITSSKNVVLSLAFLRLGLPAFPLHDLLHIIIDHLQPNILAIPSYSSFSTPDRRLFSRFLTPVSSNLGSFSQRLLQSYPSYRLLSPTHSFFILPNNLDIHNHVFTDAFGSNSSFSFLHELDFHWVNIGVEPFETATYLHHAEYLNRSFVNYRQNVHFDVDLIRNLDSSKIEQFRYTYFDRVKSHYLSDWQPLFSLDNSFLSFSSLPYVSLVNIPDAINLASQLISTNSQVFCSTA